MGIRERKEREKSERRQMILEAAKKLFMLNGYKSTTIEEIAAKAELSPATIYLGETQPVESPTDRFPTCAESGLAVRGFDSRRLLEMYFESDSERVKHTCEAYDRSDVVVAESQRRDHLSPAAAIVRSLAPHVQFAELAARDGRSRDIHRLTWCRDMCVTLLSQSLRRYTWSKQDAKAIRALDPRGVLKLLRRTISDLEVCTVGRRWFCGYIAEEGETMRASTAIRTRSKPTRLNRLVARRA